MTVKSTDLALDELDRKQLAAEDEEKRLHNEGCCDWTCWICIEAREIGKDAIGG